VTAPLAPAGAFRTAGVLFVGRQGAARLGQSWLGVPARAALTGIAALADRAGLIEGGRGPIGLGLAVGFGTFQLSASVLPANVPNLVMAGAMERACHIHLTHLSYLVLHARCSACSRELC
jgi:hypothetical protein